MLPIINALQAIALAVLTKHASTTHGVTITQMIELPAQLIAPRKTIAGVELMGTNSGSVK